MKKIFLVGFMGCGKSSFGRRLAGRLGWSFIDTDNEIERRAGMTVAEIFATLGEAHFRELERTVIEDVARSEPDKGLVVALGGGAVCQEGIMELLNGFGTTVYLRMPPSRLVRRMGTKGRAKRPRIAGMNDEELLDFIRKTLPQRESWYKKANFVLECGGVPDSLIVDLLMKYT